VQDLLTAKALVKGQLILSIEKCQTLEELMAIATTNKIVLKESTEVVEIDDGLNEGQAIALAALKKFTQGNEQWFRLSGYAGTGKSYTLARFVEWAITKGIKFCVASPTHKALKNIKRMLTAIDLREGVDYHAVTLAKLLGRVADVDTESGKQLFVTRDDFDGIKNFDLIIIDEYSMVGQETFDDICQECEPFTQIVAVGDPGQLPPVGEEISPIAVLDCPSATLTEIVRYDGEIVAVAEAIRTDPQYQERLYRFHSSDDQTIRVIPPEPIWLDQAVELFTSPDWEANPDYCRAIAWKNSTVAGFNRAIRQRIHGKDVPDFIVGDRLVARAPITRLGVLGWTIVADNREEFVVVCEPMAIADDETDWEYYAITAKSETGLVHHLRILTPASEKLRDKRKKELAKEAKALKAKGDDKYRDKWRLFYDMGRSFDNVTHALCMTAHSAQGSTIDNVFLYAKEMRFCSEKQQILYTSLTRAKSACFICQ
jgi:hypothetical protein